MAKAKPKAEIFVAAHGGKLAQVVDRRFENEDTWPIRFEVPKEQAGTWMAYFKAECRRRGWSSGGVVQPDAKENSGSLTITTNAEPVRQLAVVWDWKKAGTIKVRAKLIGESDACLSEARELFDQAMRRCKAGETERLYRRTCVYYDGLPWRGELWLDEFTRLGPPAHQYEDALFGPRVVFVDALVECVGLGDDDAFRRLIHEVAGFLSVMMRTRISEHQTQQAWTWCSGEEQCKVRNVGYFQNENPNEMPVKGAFATVPLKPVTRPEFSRRVDLGETAEEWMPEDVVELWSKLRTLQAEKRRDFVHSVAKWQEALLHWQNRPTLSFALMVVACEALKPATADHRQNVYAVIEALFGKAKADSLKQAAIPPENVRNAHLHRGVSRSSEFVFDLLASTFDEPAFRKAHEEMWYTTPAAIIEWLQRGGIVTMPPLKGPRGSRTKR